MTFYRVLEIYFALSLLSFLSNGRQMGEIRQKNTQASTFLTCRHSLILKLSPFSDATSVLKLTRNLSTDLTKHFCVIYVLLTDVSFWQITVLCAIARNESGSIYEDAAFILS